MLALLFVERFASLFVCQSRGICTWPPPILLVFIVSAKSQIVCDIPKDTASIVASEQKGWGSGLDDDVFSQLWLIQAVKGSATADTYTIQNLKTGTCFSLGDSHAMHFPLVGHERKFHSDHNSGKQEWLIQDASDDSDSKLYRIQNTISKTFVNYAADGPGKIIEHSDGTWDEAQVSQTWALQSVSITGAQIVPILQKAPNMRGNFTAFQSDGNYLVLPQSTWSDIWKNSGLGRYTWRPETFDCDDFVSVFRGCIAQWAYSNIASNVQAGILCGMIYGTASNNESHAFCFNISQDFREVLLFEPQNGTVDQARLAQYKPYLVVF